MDKVIEFSTNWNNKLNCEAFTSLRLFNPAKYMPGLEYSVVLHGILKGNAVLISSKILYLNQINRYIALLDTGYDEEECKKILKEMYKNKMVDWNTQRLSLLLFRYVKPTQKTLFDE